MNLENLKKASKVDKKIVYRKIKEKILNSVIDKFYKLRDSNLSTYSYDYISYFKLDTTFNYNFPTLFRLDEESEELEEFVNNCIKHDFKILSDKYKPVNSSYSFDSIQKKYSQKLIPFSTLCFNKISDSYNLIDWQKDFNANYNWNFEWYKSISYGNNSGSDIKVPWELGRLQHLPYLAYYYSISNKLEVKEEIRNQIFDFMASNPPKFGVQWMTSMDIGIRLVNIIFTLKQFTQHKQLFDTSEMELVNSYLFDHYQHIKDNIEFSEGMRGNHYLSNLCSIVVYLCHIEETNGKSELLDKYIRLINIELSYQFYSDGTNFEASTRYHIFTSQMLVTADLILQKLAGLSLDNSRMNRITSFTSELLRFEYPPQIGDNDSGYYWKIINSELLTSQSLIRTIKSNYIVDRLSNHLEFGYISKKVNNIDFIFKCGKVGQNGKGGHDHNDNLSYCLYFNQIPFVVDIGTYCYTSNFEKRNYYRSSLQHNVMTINQVEQNMFSDNTNNDMFWLDTADTNPIIVKNETDKIEANIEYCSKEYRREILLGSNVITVNDKYQSELEKEIRIHLHPDVNIENVEKDVYKLWINENTILLDTKANHSRIEKYMYSPEYGIEIESKRIIITSNNEQITHIFRSAE